MISDAASMQGGPYPLGVSWLTAGSVYNFALYSKDATAVTLLLYDDSDYIRPLIEIPFRFPENKSGRVWHCAVPVQVATEAKYYAYRVDGPNASGAGQRFDPDKVLLDPYSRGVFFPPDHSRAAACLPGSNAGKAPLGVLPPQQGLLWRRVRKAPTPTHALVIYELHVRGFTRRSNSGVVDRARGTFAGVVAKIPYLQDLGVTAV